MRDDHPSPAPDFRMACVVLFGFNIAWVFVVVWAVWGLLYVLLLAFTLNHAMTRIEAWSVARAEARRKDPKPSFWW